ncbi:MAG: sigma-70 family RNA polymerase sigma factor [Planctomycetes bacterium]|nr:sigma-70 family RNA polymerase sigma factor [Planctomycetota bacterium]
MAAANSPSTSETLLRMLTSPTTSEIAWKMFLDRYTPLIERWCNQAGLQSADADEVKSRVLTNLVKALKAFELDPAFRFRGWLKTVVNNALRSFWREGRRKPGVRGHGGEGVLEQLSIPDPLSRLADELDDQLSHDLELAELVIEQVKQRVEEHTWEAYWRTAIDGELAADVAHQLGLSVALVYVAKGRVAKLLRSEVLRLRDSEPD